MGRALPCILLILAGSLAACTREGGQGLDPSLIREIARDDLVITVRERGEIKAARDTRVSSEVEGRATLIYLIPEGTVVAEGQKVAELDVSGIQEKRALQAITVARVEASLEQALKNAEIVEKELQALAKTAETRFRIAEMRLEKFLGQNAGSSEGRVELASGTNREMVTRLGSLLENDAPGSAGEATLARLVDRVHEILGSEENVGREMGEMAGQILQQIDEIRVASADLEQAVETLYHSRKLAGKGFITANQLKRDEINHDRQLSQQALAWNNLLLLISYTLPETLLGLELEVENARLALESARAGNEARRVREQAELRSIEAEHGLAKQQLENWDRQIQNGVLRAPAPGLVVYGRWDWDEPVYEGMEVRERQEVIILPDVSTMMVELKVPEAQIGRVAEGQAASIQVDAFPNQQFTGRITHVSTLPDPGPRRQVLKLYITHVLIDGDNSQGSLRPGMNCTVIIEVGTLQDVLPVPVPALERRGDIHYVWKMAPHGPVASEVQLGGNNLTHVEVIAGLDEGDRIYLVRPPGAALPSAEQDGAAAGSPPPDAARDDSGGAAAGNVSLSPAAGDASN